MENTQNELRLIDTVRSTFADRYKSDCIVVLAPGRINLIGEHTDYHGGFVMPAAIDKGIAMALANNGTDKCRVYSLDFNQEIEFDLEVPILPSSIGWLNYIVGVMAQLMRKGIKLRGVDIVFGGNIPIGSGLSSSAALECATILGLTTLWGTPIPNMDMVALAQIAEHEYAGVKCGIMDQFASMMGRKGHAVLLDCDKFTYDYIPVALEGYEVVLFNTMVKHNLGDTEYNKRQQECSEGLEIIKRHFTEVTKLREASLEMLDRCKSEMRPLIYSRCLFVVQEIGRVLRAGKCLKAGDIDQFGQLMYSTHDGLSRLYEVSCKELDFIVEACRKTDSVKGARMMGGGFGGCVIAIVNSSSLDTLNDHLSSTYKKTFGREMQIYNVSMEEGAHVVV